MSSANRPFLNVIFGLLLMLTQVSLNCGKILVNPKDTVVLEGQTTALYCYFSISTKTTTQCYWTRDGTVIDVGQFLGTYEWLGDYKTGNCSIKIIGAANERDDGVWRCQLPATATQTEGEVSNPARLSVYVTPTTPEMYYDEQKVMPTANLEIPENVTEMLQCVSRYGNPPPTLYYTLDGVNVMPDSEITEIEVDKPKTYKKTIELKRVYSRKDTDKELYCNLQHVTLNNTTRFISVTLNITYSTTIVETLSPNYVVVDQGSGYTFICKADGNPPAKCEWLYKNSEAENWEIKSKNCKYMLESSQPHDEGEYMCLAGNGGQLQPSNVITFTLRGKTQNIVAIIGGIFGTLAVIAIIILIYIVIRLRKRILKKSQCSPPTIADLEKAESNALVQRNRNVDPTYMVPIPTEMAPLNPGKSLWNPTYESSHTKFEGARDRDTHIYAEPQYIELPAGNEYVDISDPDPANRPLPSLPSTPMPDCEESFI